MRWMVRLLVFLWALGASGEAGALERVCPTEQRVDYVGMAVKVGDKLPNSSLFLPQEQRAARIRDLAPGTLTLLVFWSATCPECLDEIKALPELRARFSEEDLSILSIAPAYDDGQMRAKYGDASWDAIKAGLGATVACIDDYGSATLEYKVDEVPYMVLIDKDNVCKTWVLGKTAVEDLVRVIERQMP